MYRITTVQLLELYQVRSVLVYDRVERETVTPRGGEVPYVDVVVTGSLHLAPEEQSVLGGLGFFVVGLFDCYVLDLGEIFKYFINFTFYK